jgi:hypothetical protein
MEGPITLMLSSNIPLTIELSNYNPATETFDIRVIGPQALTSEYGCLETPA